ncbi:MAG TPA: TIM44-like domain-containing protein [Dehalococcoidia bacterium]|nr:TIM44-like domain-containing protein [Dehalococcoidia bacterium]
MPNGLTYMLMRPLAIPLALAALGLGFVLWRFMGDIPSVLGMGLQVLFDGFRHGGRPAAPAVALPVAYPVDAGVDSIRAVDPGFSTPAFLAEVQRIGGLVVAGWAEKNLANCRSLMTDTCWDLEAGQMTRPLAEGWRPFARTVTVEPESIVAVRSDAGTDQISVRLRMRFPPGSGKVTRGRRIGEWIEDWTLTRSRVRSSDTWRVDRMNHVAIHFERAA